MDNSPPMFVDRYGNLIPLGSDMAVYLLEALQPVPDYASESLQAESIFR